MLGRGGIVMDSVLEDEYQESLDKAAAMLNVSPTQKFSRWVPERLPEPATELAGVRPQPRAWKAERPLQPDAGRGPGALLV